MVELYGVEMTGKTVLDIGGYDGRGAIALLEAGAAVAVVVDNGQWKHYDWGPPGQDDRVRYVEGDLLDWGREADVVLCFNVIYHLRDPQRGLYQLRHLTREALLLRTSFVAEDEAGEDGWRWYPDGTGHPNGTVWARPSRSGLVRALEHAGFLSVIEMPVGGANDEATYVCR